MKGEVTDAHRVLSSPPAVDGEALRLPVRLASFGTGWRFCGALHKMGWRTIIGFCQ